MDAEESEKRRNDIDRIIVVQKLIRQVDGSSCSVFSRLKLSVLLGAHVRVVLAGGLDGLVAGRGVVTAFVAAVRAADAGVEALAAAGAVLRRGRRRRRRRGSPGPLLGPLVEVIVPHARSL